MYPKYKTEQLVKKFSPKLIRLLGLTRHKLEFHVAHSKKFKPKAGNCKGVSYTTTNAAEIVIYYNQHNTQRDTVATLVHELLHVRVHKLWSCSTILETKATIIEEKLVQSLEKTIVYYLTKAGELE